MTQEALNEAIEQIKAEAKGPITEQDWYELLAGALAIRKHFKGHLISITGGESGQDLFDRKLESLWGLKFVAEPSEKKKRSQFKRRKK